jgi:hypothetical protein
VNCRIEDQTTGLVMESTSNVLVSACLFDRNISPIILKDCNNITINSCMSSSAGNGGSGNGGTGTHVLFAPNFWGSNAFDNIQLGANVYNQGAATTSYTYGVSSGVTVTNSAILESGGGNTAVYQDSYSSSVLTPFRVTLP